MKVIKVPSEQGSFEKNKGTREAPDAIAKALGIEADSIELVENDIEATDRAIYEKAKECFEKQKGGRNFTCIFLGGDHSITYSLFSAFSDVFGKDSGFVVFDAHADATSLFKPVSHEDMNRVLVEEGKLKAGNLLIIGLRKVWKGEEGWLRKQGIKPAKAGAVRKDLESVKKNVGEFCRRHKNIYLSVDVDVFSPEVMKATGYLEKDGLSENEVRELISIIRASGKLKDLDIVEYNPKMDKDGKGMKVVKRLIDLLE